MHRLFLFVVAVLCLVAPGTTALAQTPIIVEDFDYPPGDTLHNRPGYSVRSGAGVNVQRAIAPGLTYAGYAGSGIGNCDSLYNNGEDLSKDALDTVRSGSAYLAAMVKVGAAQATGDFFLSFHYNNTFNGKVFVRSTTGGFVFGSAKNTAVYDVITRSYDSTYLVVVKYTFNTVSGTDDRIDFFVNPVIGDPEPTPTIANMTDAARADYAGISGVTIRQGSATAAPTVKVDGIRFARTWAAAVAGPSFTITASAVGGGTITPSGAVQVNGGANQQFTYAPNTGYHFDSLLVDGSRVDSTTSYTFLAVGAAHTITAYFSANQYTLTVNATNGTVAKDPDQATYVYGASVSLTATPSTGYSFVNWTGDVPGGHETDNPLIVTMDTNKTLTANFSSNTFTITASAIGGGTITPSGSVSVNSGADQRFVFGPTTGHHFDSLLVDGTNVDSTSSYTFTTVSAAHTITAYFSPNQYALTVNATHGTVTREPDQATYAYHTVVRLTAVPDSGYRFSGWSGNLSGSANPDSVFVDSAMTITAVFGVGTNYTWSGGTGNWSVASNWTPNGVPGFVDSVFFAVTSPVSICTIDQNASCAKLVMTGSGSSLSTGPVLQFPASGPVSLTVTDTLRIAGGSGGGGGDRGGRSKLTSNGNPQAKLVLMGYAFTGSSNQSSNGDAGLNMHEGTTLIGGPAPSSLVITAGCRVGDLVVGDSVHPKAFTLMTGSVTSSQRMSPSSVTVRPGCSFTLGDPAANYAVNVGNTTVGVTNLTGGVVIGPGATLAVNPTTGTANSCTIELMGGGIVNDGSIVTSATNRFLNVNVTAGVNTFGGASEIAFNNLTLNNPAGIALTQSAAINGVLTLIKGKVLLGAGNLTISSAGSIAGASDSMYIVTDGTGSLVYEGVSSSFKVFPVGPPTSFNPVTIGNAGTTDKFSVRVSGTFGTSPVDSAVFLNREWIVAEGVPGGSDVTLMLQYNGTDPGGASFVHAATPKFINRFTGTTWLPIAATLNGTGPYLAATINVQEFGPFAVSDTRLVSVAGERVPVEFALLQNYPNPFNPTTSIKFSVHQKGHATLQMFNVIGQIVATLYNDVAEVGRYYDVQWDATGLASGVYFYRLQSGSKVELKKLLLLK